MSGLATEERKLGEATSRQLMHYHLDDSQMTNLDSEPMSIVDDQQHFKIDKLLLSGSEEDEEVKI